MRLEDVDPAQSEGRPVEEEVHEGGAFFVDSRTYHEVSGDADLDAAIGTAVGVGVRTRCLAVKRSRRIHVGTRKPVELYRKAGAEKKHEFGNWNENGAEILNRTLLRTSAYERNVTSSRKRIGGREDREKFSPFGLVADAGWQRRMKMSSTIR